MLEGSSVSSDTLATPYDVGRRAPAQSCAAGVSCVCDGMYVCTVGRYHMADCYRSTCGTHDGRSVVLSASCVCLEFSAADSLSARAPKGRVVTICNTVVRV